VSDHELLRHSRHALLEGFDDAGVEASLRQCARLQSAETISAASTAEAGLQSGLAIAFVQGRWLQFAKSGFRKRPSEAAEPLVKLLFPDPARIS